MCYGMNCGYEGSSGTCGSYSRPEDYPCHNGFHEPETRIFKYSDIQYWETLVIEELENEYAGQFVSEHIDPASVPEGKFLYEIQHDKEDEDLPCEIRNKVEDNFYGSFISNVPLPSNTIEDWWYD